MKTIIIIIILIGIESSFAEKYTGFDPAKIVKDIKKVETIIEGHIKKSVQSIKEKSRLKKK